MAGDIRSSKRFRELAAFLQERAGREGVKLVGGEAEDLLAGRLTAIATQLGVTPRTALGYVSEDNLELLAQQLGSLAGEYDDAAGTTAPVVILFTDAGRVVAALGMAVKLAAEHVEGHQADALGITTGGADALVGLGVAMSAAKGDSEFRFGGQHLVWTRKVLVRTIELIGDGTWACPCEGVSQRKTAGQRLSASFGAGHAQAGSSSAGGRCALAASNSTCSTVARSGVM